MKRTTTTLLAAMTLLALGAAFTASFFALLGGASAVGLPERAAYAYAATPDLSTAVALLGGLVMRHDRDARRTVLASLIVFGAGSAVLNGAAALGTIPHGFTGERVIGLPVWLALTIAAMPVLGVVLSAHLVVRISSTLWPDLVNAKSMPPKRSALSRSLAAMRSWGNRGENPGDAPGDAQDKPEKAPEEKAEQRNQAELARRTDAEVLDEARAFVRKHLAKGGTVTGLSLKNGISVGNKRAYKLLAALQTEGLVPTP